METNRVGRLIYSLRTEKQMTQKQLADAMHISDKTVSKWERGLGYPDVSLLGSLSQILGVNIEKILSGELNPNEADGGNMKRVKFYICPGCGNVITSTGEADISCCGRKVSALTAQPADEEHSLKVEEIEYDYYITFPHEMNKEHYISFIAYVHGDRMLFVRLYPEQGGEVRFPRFGRRGKIYFGCTGHGLWVQNL